MKIAYDCKLYRPACVLLQAALGGEQYVAYAFEPRHWLVSPTPDMAVYEATPEQLARLVELTDRHAKD